MVQIISIGESSRQTKRFVATLNNGEKIHFGNKGSSTYLDHHDKTKRDNYRKRHLLNPLENSLINNLKMSPALLSYYVLWGDSTNMNNNVINLNKLLKE